MTDITAPIIRLYAEGRYEEAERRVDNVLNGLAVGSPPPQRLLTLKAVLLRRRGAKAEAEEVLRAAIEQDPRDFDARNNLGNSLNERGRHAEAAIELRLALSINGGLAPAWNNLGNALAALGDFTEALACYDRAIALNAGYAEAFGNRGKLLDDLGRREEARRDYQTALALNPALPDPLLNAGNQLAVGGRIMEAVATYRRGMELHPGNRKFAAAIALALMRIGEAEESVRHTSAILPVDPDPVYISNHLFALNGVASWSGAAIAAEHRRWGALFTAKRLPLKPDRDLARPPRVGYVSNDFRNHSVARFVEPLLAAHDPEAVSVFCYSTSPFRDQVTARLRSLTPAWRECVGQPADVMARRIQDDGIDILVDLGGHTAGGRLDLFALKPAPIQMTWLGYPNTTGVPAIDYRLTDAIADPPGESDAWHTERLIRPWPCFLLFGPLAIAPAVAPLPALSHSGVTFGSFNAQSKLNERCYALWAGVLNALPDSRLVIKNAVLDEPAVVDRVKRAFVDRGVPTERVLCVGGTMGDAEHLDTYRQIDIALDSVPYNGTTTSCEALWMGVPVITLLGDRHVARVGASLLNAIGLPELVAGDDESFIEIARRLAGDLPALARLRGGLRGRMLTSPLMDAVGFARALEGAYREMRRDYATTWLDADDGLGNASGSAGDGSV